MNTPSIWNGNEDRYEETARRAAAKAADDREATATCVSGGEKVFWHVGPYGVVPGHIYSRDGAIEYRRGTGMCEFHFDAYFAEEEDLSERGWQIVAEYRASQNDG